ncbi:putative uncharacterized protein [Corallococcus sp. CAG:1435]|nr:putative uncharacterized protein [Corallococcus sp. CAG:1435]
MYGKEIRSARIANGKTQTDVAKATGIPQNTLSWIELDKGLANIQQCVLLADFYGITLDELIGRDFQQSGGSGNSHNKR